MKYLFIIFCKLLLILVLTYTPALSFDEVDLKKFLAIEKCFGCDLSGANLSGANLSGADLYGTDLSGADLRGAKMKHADLSSSIFCKTQTPWGEDNTGC